MSDMTQEDYCSYEVSKLLKEKGFDELCIFKYNYKGIRMKAGEAIDEWKNSELDDDEYSCPSQSMAMKWLREEKRTSIIIEFDLTKRLYCPYVHQLDYDMDWVVKWRVNTPMKYEEAVEAACLYALKNLI